LSPVEAQIVRKGSLRQTLRPVSSSSPTRASRRPISAASRRLIVPQRPSGV